MAVWSCFAAQEASQLVELVKKALDHLGYEYDMKKGRPRTVLDPVHPSTIIFVKGEEEFRCKIFHASNDPFTRFFVNVISSKYASLMISLLEISPVTKANRRQVSGLLRELVKRADKKPWLIDHPRFKMSWLLSWRNKRRWQYFLDQK